MGGELMQIFCIAVDIAVIVIPEKYSYKQHYVK